MELQEVFKKRRTYREFQKKEIPQEIIEKVIVNGMQAPSNSHIRNWFFINVKDRKQREELVGPKGEDLLKQRNVEHDIEKTGIKDEASQEMYRYSIPKQASMILDAGLVLIPTFHQPFPLMHPTERKHLNYFASIWMSIENILLSAVEEDIYGVTYIPNHPEKLMRLLKIPEGYDIACILALGYPIEKAKKFQPDKFELQNIIRDNSWV
ncbi:MAG: nitroreductase family protein [Candidatus Heimdallarchaeota archaeon]|nr:nitroreductase family protein [Candidatus Heimdallarchaeota archaeon]